MVGRFEWERALRAAENVPWHVKSLLLMVGTWMSADGSNARPSLAALSSATGLSRSRVIELLGIAEESGWLRPVRTRGKVTLRHAAIPDPSNQSDPSNEQDPSDPPDRSTGSTRPTHRTRGSDPPDGTRPTHRTQQSQDNPLITHPDRDEDDDLATFAKKVNATPEQLRQVAKQHPTRVVALVPWLEKLHANGDLLPKVDVVKEAEHKAIRRTLVDEAPDHPDCRHHIPGGNRRKPGYDWCVCPDCRRELTEQSADMQQEEVTA
ncbi:hypothetical protein [Amycolatopsis anabasis]|uniref:hypothetical protein n=1 Tax=Amycolatopsis anabasis TaxID=1840409 RepID=UPI00131B461A|nr:hypothetical protein [Amycolatopsis anabasis]